MNSNMLLNGSSKSQFHDSMDFDLHNSVTGSQRGGGGGGDDLFENTQKGDKIISASRCIFFSVLFVAAAVLATVAFLLYRQEETETFERAVRFVLPAAAVVVFFPNSNPVICLFVFPFSLMFLPSQHSMFYLLRYYSLRIKPKKLCYTRITTSIPHSRHCVDCQRPQRRWSNGWRNRAWIIPVRFIRCPSFSLYAIVLFFPFHC